MRCSVGGTFQPANRPAFFYWKGFIVLQSYPWYIADWRESETRRRLTLLERSLYRELLDYCYLEGSLPDNRKMLLEIAGCSAEAEAEHLVSTGEALPEHSLRTARALLGHSLSTVLALFEHCESTHRYRHPKVEEVRPKLLSYHEQKRHAGTLSGQSRRERALNSRSVSFGTNSEPHPSPSPTPSIEEQNTPLPPLATLAVEKTVPSKDWIQEQHAVWYDRAFWNHKNRAASLKAFDKQIRTLVKTMSCQEAAEFLYNKAVDDRARFEPTSDWEWRRNLHPATWLNGARWEDQPVSGGTNGKPSAADRTHALAKSRFESFGHI